MHEMPFVYLVLPFALAWATATEIKYHRISNYLTVPLMALGLGAGLITGDLAGLKDAFIGLMIGGGVFLPFCLLGVVGGGDMKLMAAVGSVVSYPMILRTLTDTCIAGGLLAIAIMAWNGIFFTTLANCFRIMVGMPRRHQGLRNPPMVPYGLAIAVGTLFSVFCQSF